MAQKLNALSVALPALILAFGSGVATAGTTIEEAGAMVCVNEKWDEKEPEKGHKLVDYAGPCVDVPDDSAAEKFVENCTGKYEYMPDGSWKGAGSCALKLKDGNVTATWEEGSHLKESTYTYTSGDGKYQGVSGGGTYKNDNLTDTLAGGRYKGKMQMP